MPPVDFTLEAIATGASPPGAFITTVTFQISDPAGAAVQTISLDLPNEIAQNIGIGDAAEFAVTMTDIPADLILTPLDAHTYVGAVVGQVAPQYMGAQVAALTAKLYSRIIATGVDTHIADSAVTAAGTFSISAATNPLAVGSEFVVKLFDAGANQVGADTVIPV
jgi:hypothetical protein